MPKTDPFSFALKFVGKDELRPAMMGVYHKGGYLYATDAHKLLKVKTDYPKSREGKILDKNMQPVKSDGKIVERYPNAESVIPERKNLEPYQIDLDELRKVYNEAVRKNKEILSKSDKYQKKWILQEEGRVSVLFRDPFDPELKLGVALAIDQIPLLIRFMKENATDTIWVSKVSPEKKAVTVYADSGLAMFMPMFYEDAGHIKYKIDMRNKYWRKETPVRKTQKMQTKTQKPTAMTRKRTTAKANGSSTTMRDASLILKKQKSAYKKIFAAEVKKSKDPKAGAKKAGKIYRDRYGATATARWKKALKRAK